MLKTNTNRAHSSLFNHSVSLLFTHVVRLEKAKIAKNSDPGQQRAEPKHQTAKVIVLRGAAEFLKTSSIILDSHS